MSRPPFAKEDIRTFLANSGYISNPDGLVEQFLVDYVFESEDVMHLDINADAVRKRDEVPDRPVRLTFHKSVDGPSSSWKLKSVAELAPGIESKALDRQGDTKVSPWPTGGKRMGKITLDSLREFVMKHGDLTIRDQSGTTRILKSGAPDYFDLAEKADRFLYEGRLYTREEFSALMDRLDA